MLTRMSTDPNAVWDLIRKADELVKYASNRDPAVAREQARKQLARASEAAAALEDRKAAEALGQQIRRRLQDLQSAER